MKPVKINFARRIEKETRKWSRPQHLSRWRQRLWCIDCSGPQNRSEYWLLCFKLLPAPEIDHIVLFILKIRRLCVHRNERRGVSHVWWLDENWPDSLSRCCSVPSNFEVVDTSEASWERERLLKVWTPVRPLGEGKAVEGDVSNDLYTV